MCLLVVLTLVLPLHLESVSVWMGNLMCQFDDFVRKVVVPRRDAVPFFAGCGSTPWSVAPPFPQVVLVFWWSFTPLFSRSAVLDSPSLEGCAMCCSCSSVPGLCGRSAYSGGPRVFTSLLK